jgi:hypothetical protein
MTMNAENSLGVPEKKVNFAEFLINKIGNRLGLTHDQAAEFVQLPLDQQRRGVELLTGEPVVLEGSGPVGTPPLISHEKVERFVDEALK